MLRKLILALIYSFLGTSVYKLNLGFLQREVHIMSILVIFGALFGLGLGLEYIFDHENKISFRIVVTIIAVFFIGLVIGMVDNAWPAEELIAEKRPSILQELGQKENWQEFQLIDKKFPKKLRFSILKPKNGKLPNLVAVIYWNSELVAYAQNIIFDKEVNYYTWDNAVWNVKISAESGWTNFKEFNVMNLYINSRYHDFGDNKARRVLSIRITSEEGVMIIFRYFYY